MEITELVEKHGLTPEDAEALYQAIQENRMPTYEDIAVMINRKMLDEGQWAGTPVPIAGYSLSLDEKYPNQALSQYLPRGDEPEKLHVSRTEDVESDAFIRNEFYCHRRKVLVTIVQEKGRVYCLQTRTLRRPPELEKLEMLIKTMGASHAWVMQAECAAMEKLMREVNDFQFRCYMLLGYFPEESHRSGLTYIFRRARPTIVVRKTDQGTRPICALCLHPIGYYNRTFAGSMVPTDDVLAHLFLMRGDEPMLWRRANQHPLDSAEAGI